MVFHLSDGLSVLPEGFPKKIFFLILVILLKRKNDAMATIIRKAI